MRSSAESEEKREFVSDIALVMDSLKVLDPDGHWRSGPLSVIKKRGTLQTRGQKKNCSARATLARSARQKVFQSNLACERLLADLGRVLATPVSVPCA